MRKTFLSVSLAALIAAALVSSSGVATAKPKAGPVVVGTDAAGDWGSATDSNLGAAGDALGMDLIEASIESAGANLNFIIKVNSLPAPGGTPEVARYTWDFNIDGEAVELDGKFTNYSRGVCDPTAGSCPPPRNPGMQPFFVRGECAIDATTPQQVTICKELGVVQATFDAAAGTITIPVPKALIKAKPGSKITPGLGLDGGTVEAVPAAFLSRGGGPADQLTATKTFVVPKK